MEKYRLKPQIVEAKQYETGMEDGFHQYYWYENYSYGLEDERIGSPTLFGLEKLREKLLEKEEDCNRIEFEKPVPVIKTKYGLKKIKPNDYIVIDEYGDKLLVSKEDFEKLYEKIQGGQK